MRNQILQQNMHPIAKARGHLVILVLFFQELNRQTLLLPPVCQQRGHTSNVALATRNTDDNLRNWVKLPGAIYTC